MRFSQFLVRGALCLATLAGTLGAQSIVVLTGSQGGSTSIPVFTANPLLPQATASGVPAGAFQLLVKPDGSKYYLITVSSGLTVLDRNFANPKQILTTLNASPTRAVLSPDGKRLFVIAGSAAYFIDTATDSIVSGALNLTGTPVDVAFSIDSLTAFILTNGAFTAYVTPVDLTTYLPGQNINLPLNGTATGISTGPNGMLYVSAQNGLYEINPRTLLITPGTTAGSGATIPVNGTPGKVQFTSDGQNAVALNRTPATGAAIIFNLQAKTATLATAANLNGALDQLVVAADTRIFAHSTQNQLYELSLGGGFVSSLVVSALPTGSAVQSILPTNEAQARSLFVIATVNGAYILYKVDLGTNSLGGQQPLPSQSGQVLAFAGTNPTSGGAAVQGIGTSQTVSAGAVSLPLVARVLDANGLPVFNASVNFTVVSGGVTLSSSTATTNSNGYAQVSATAGANAGAYTVQATSPGAGSGAGFTINVSAGSTGTGGCTSNCAASGLFVVSGSGQIISEQQIAQQLLLVAVRDANGNPVPNQQVTFSVTQGQGTISCTGIGDQFPYVPAGACTVSISGSTGLTSSLTVVTDVTGQAGVKYLASSTSSQSFAQTVVNATANAGSVNFTITTVLGVRTLGTGQASLPLAQVLAPDPSATPPFTGIRVITGTAGQTIKGAIQVQVTAVEAPQSGLPIPGVALNVSGAGDSKTSPSATCAGGPPITDASGIATCDLVLGPVAGTGALSVNVGGAIQTPLFEIVVSPGLPGKINIVQGNNQQGNAGQQITLKAVVTDAAGNANPGVPVTWAVTSGIATISGASQQTDSQGVAQSTVTLGTSTGNVLVRLTAGSGSTAATTTFTLTVNVPINVGAVTPVSGTGQTAVTGQAFGAPLVVRVSDTNGQPIPGVTVAFTVTAGAATLASPSAKTDSQGNAATTVTAGGAGTIVIQASTASQSTQFSLISRLPGPAIDATSFRNAASNAQGLAPCGIGIVSGVGLATGIQGTVSANTFFGPLPFSVAGVNLTVNGIPAPIYWVSNTPQGGEAVAFQTPCEVSPGSASVVVNVNGGNTTVGNVTVTKYQPGIFETIINGRKYAVLLHASDGSYVTPDNPARRGEQLKMFVTGLGTGAVPVGTDRAGIGGQASDALITVGLNNGGVRVIGSEYLPGAIGIYTITFEVPSDTATGPYQNLGLLIADPNDATGTTIYAPGSFLPIS